MDNYTWNTTICDYIATPIYTKSDLPNGTLIVQQSGNMYRPEGWTALDVISEGRPGNVTANLISQLYVKTLKEVSQFIFQRNNK